MTNYSLSLENVTKVFGRRLIFNKINYNFSSGNIYGVTGQNGSGKSTLAKIITGIISPTSGKVNHIINNKKIISEKLHNHFGFVSPYLFLYDEFSAEENIFHFSKIRGIEFDIERLKFLLSEFNLYKRKNDLLKTYSSGMKQRMKFIFALYHNPELILLDEPTENLDNNGKDKVYEIIESEGKSKCIIIASNEDADIELCTETLAIEDFKK